MARSTLLLAGTGALAALLPVAARAETASATLEVLLVVEPSCRVSAAPLSFTGRAGEMMDAAAPIAVSCNDNTPVAVRLDGGANAQGGERRLAGAGGAVAYTIYSDPARSQHWGAGEARMGTAGPVPLALTAYGRIAPGATLGALGSYRDTITVAIDF